MFKFLHLAGGEGGVLKKFKFKFLQLLQKVLQVLHVRVRVREAAPVPHSVEADVQLQVARICHHHLHLGRL